MMTVPPGLSSTRRDRFSTGGAPTAAPQEALGLRAPYDNLRSSNPSRHHEPFVVGLTVQQLIDREEIRDLLNRWALAADLSDMDAFEACYTPDAIIDFREIGYQGNTPSGHREFLEK